MTLNMWLRRSCVSHSFERAICNTYWLPEFCCHRPWWHCHLLHLCALQSTEQAAGLLVTWSIKLASREKSFSSNSTIHWPLTGGSLFPRLTSVPLSLDKGLGGGANIISSCSECLLAVWLEAAESQKECQSSLLCPPLVFKGSSLMPSDFREHFWYQPYLLAPADWVLDGQWPNGKCSPFG